MNIVYRFSCCHTPTGARIFGLLFSFLFFSLVFFKFFGENKHV